MKLKKNKISKKIFPHRNGTFRKKVYHEVTYNHPAMDLGLNVHSISDSGRT